MAVLNKIRQRGLFLVIVIALALFSFVLADLFRNSDALSAKSQNIVATINGKDISREDFLQKVETTQRQLGPQATNNQVMNQVWDQEVRQAVMESQYEALSLTIERDNMRDLIKNALSSFVEFQNEAGLFDENKLNEFIANLRESAPQPGFLAGQPIDYEGWKNYESGLAITALQQNYFNMVRAGITGTLAEGELEHKLESDKVDIRFVQIPFSSIPDNTVTVTKADISNYIRNHEKNYKVEASRNINYVEFEEVSSIDDEEEIKAGLQELLDDKVEYNDVIKANDTVIGFKNTTDIEGFVNTNSDIKYNNSYILKSGLPTAVSDSIYNLNIGEIYGPYKDNGYFKFSRVIATKQLPDSAKVRHILIPFVGANNAGADVTQTETEAKRTADSVLGIVKTNRSKFPELVTTFSSDQGSVANEGRYDWFPYNRMVPEFRDFAFENNTGDIDIVKTLFGFHIIEIEGQKNIQKAIKVATLARQIEPSETTINKVFRDASTFEIAVSEKAFHAVATESNYTVRPVNGIKIFDENIPGLGSQRTIVRWAFNVESEVGDIKRFNIPGGYAIVQLAAKGEEGLMKTENASITALPAIRKEKKAQIIRDRVTATTLEDLAPAENQSIRIASAINMKNPTISGAGREPLIVGAAFALKEGETSGLIDGNNGVYMIQVTKVQPATQLDNYQAFANRVQSQKVNTVTSNLYNALKEAADIEDNRATTVQ